MGPDAEPVGLEPDVGRHVCADDCTPAVAERVQRLERAGAIRGYHADLDPDGARVCDRSGRPHPAGTGPAPAHPADCG